MGGTENKLKTLLRDMMGEDSDLEEQGGIISSAMRHLGTREASESEMLDAILMTFDASPRTVPAQIVVDDPDDFDQILDTLSLGIRTAGNTLNLTTGTDGEKYDPKSRTYRRKGRQRNVKMEREFEIDDAAHTDPGFPEATKGRGTHRTRYDMLARES
jgi:hypothetical protein